MEGVKPMKVPDHYPGRRLGLLAAILVASLALGQVASAATVTYSTTGSFTGPGASGSTLRSDGGRGTSQLSFRGVTNVSVQINPPPVQQIDLGSFTLTKGDIFDFITGTFKLVLKQTAPSDGIGEATSTLLLGVVSKYQGGVAMYFDDPTFTIGNVTYQVAPLVLVPVGSTQFRGSLTASQAPKPVTAVVPLPTAAWGGMALICLVGASKLRRWASGGP
jgi:hypothetical protein